MKENDRKTQQQADDVCFRQLAQRYVEMEGAALREELSRGEGARAPGLDEKVRRGVHSHRWARVGAGIAAAAAGIVLVLAVPNFLRHSGATPPPDTSYADGTAGEGDTPIAFTASLPANLSISDTRQDRGQTIYYLKDTRGDDVVMALERAELPDTQGMQVRRINGTAVYTEETADYAVLIFRRGGVVYTLTCRYELNTLLNAAEKILQG